MPLLEFNSKGIYCQQADVYIDPWRPVDRAIITHGHSDHARWGMGHYLCHKHTAPIIRARLGVTNIDTVEYGETWSKNGVTFSLHPAGHVIGSAQVRVEYRGEVWVASGDYKLQHDNFSTPFEPVRCNVFITECTFGLPIYQWQPQEVIFNDINNWWLENSEQGKTSVIFGYSLGKAQRILQNLDESIGPILTHGAIENMNKVIREECCPLKPTTLITRDTPKSAWAGGLVIAPPSAAGTAWMNKLKPLSTGIASGWMSLRGARRRRAVDRGFALSDHADWNDLNTAIKETGAECIITTHGYTGTFTRWLREQGYKANEEHTEFEGELSEINEAATKEADEVATEKEEGKE